MNKIASPVELQHELQGLIQACRRPVSRLRLANALETLADRVAAEKKQKIPHSEVAEWKAGLKAHKGKKGPGGLTFGQKLEHQGKEWLVYDVDAEGSGHTLVLVSPDFTEALRGVKPPAKTAAESMVERVAERFAAAPYTIEKLKLDRDGYVNGKYYGTGDPLFHVETKDRESEAVFRARDLQHAKRIVKEEFDSKGDFKRLHREGPKR